MGIFMFCQLALSHKSFLARFTIEVFFVRMSHHVHFQRSFGSCSKLAYGTEEWFKFEVHHFNVTRQFGFFMRFEVAALTFKHIHLWLMNVIFVAF